MSVWTSVLIMPETAEEENEVEGTEPGQEYDIEEILEAMTDEVLETVIDENMEETIKRASQEKESGEDVKVELNENATDAEVEQYAEKNDEVDETEITEQNLTIEMSEEIKEQKIKKRTVRTRKSNRKVTRKSLKEDNNDSEDEKVEDDDDENKYKGKGKKIKSKSLAKREKKKDEDSEWKADDESKEERKPKNVIKKARKTKKEQKIEMDCPFQYHVMDNRDPRKMCSMCYQKLRLTMTSQQAAYKVKRVRQFCVQCDRHYCASCFYELHIEAKD